MAELAANALLHGRARGRDFRLGLALRDDGTLRIEVTDARGDRIPGTPDPAAQDPAAQDSSTQDPAVRDPAVQESESGRGLLIVAAYARRWGVDGAPVHAKTV
ncbi:ATP-binding protein [Streptomyces sp. NPDC020800]|uniref:ATP-binding protein n=1 Tax=Streptomyces sp. NPDC020800 TaxID=3365092 RepID=UPI0037A1CFA6